jgi:tRNA-splicing ligase RtcB
MTLSHVNFESTRRKEGAVEFGTLGSGNHFIELQADEEGRLWLMVHRGSRAIGQAIRDHHMASAEAAGSGLRALDARSDAGIAYLHDAAWARRFAEANRRAMATDVGEVLAAILGARTCWDTAIATDGVWYDHRLSKALRDEAPAAYKDIRAVLRAQHELVKVLNHKES